MRHLFTPPTSDWFQELHPEWLLPSLMAGLVNGLSGLVQAMSLAALIFTGPFQADLPLAISSFLIGSILVRLVVALLSSFTWIGVDLEESVAAILSMIALSVSQSLSNADGRATNTLFAIIVLSSVATGAFLFILGRLRLGNLIRFVPYPVIGGFVGGIGWLLTVGGFQVMLNDTLGFSLIPNLLQPNRLLQWLPGTLLAILLVLLMRYYSHFLILPGCLLIASGVFYGLLWLTHTPLAVAVHQGWLLGFSGSGSVLKLPDLTAVTQIHWGVVVNQLGSIATIPLLSAVGLLLNTIGLELATERDIDLNQQLRATGIANLLAGAAASMVGYTCISDSTLAYRMGVRSRLSSFISMGLLGAFLVLGPSFLGFFPRFILGGLLLLLGLEMLVEWVYDARSRLPMTDYMIVLMILAVSATVGFLQAVAFGIGIALVLFVINYSRIPVTRLLLSGANFHSHVARPTSHIRLLEQEGDQIAVLVLQGFLFFGTANQLLDQVRRRVQEDHTSTDSKNQGHPLRFIVLDFRLVHGIDTSAVVSFLKLKQLAQQQSLQLIFADLSPMMQHRLEQGGCLEAEGSTTVMVPDRDRALQWCEDQILDASPLRRRRTLPLAIQLEGWFTEPIHVSQFMDYLEEQDREVGEVLFHQGEMADALYWIEVGEVMIQQERNGHLRRLHHLGSGSLVGEMDFHLNIPHQTSAIVSKSSTLYRLSRARAEQMRWEQPAVMTSFQEMVIYSLSNRLVAANQEVSDLLQ